MRNLIAFFSLAAVILLSSCGNDGAGEAVVCSYDIVCLKDQTAAAGSVFSMYLPDSDREIVYTDSRAVIDTSAVAIGDRLMIAYVTEGEPYESGNVTVRGYTPVHNSMLMVSPGGIENTLADWRRDGIYLYSIWRSGNFINVRARLTYSSESREFVLVVDADEVDAKVPVPTARLVHRMAQPVENFERQIYSSFDIGALWNLPWIEGLKVELANTNLKTDTFTFTKNKN